MCLECYRVRADKVKIANQRSICNEHPFKHRYLIWTLHPRPLVTRRLLTRGYGRFVQMIRPENFCNGTPRLRLRADPNKANSRPYDGDVGNFNKFEILSKALCYFRDWTERLRCQDACWWFENSHVRAHMVILSRKKQKPDIRCALSKFALEATSPLTAYWIHRRYSQTAAHFMQDNLLFSCRDDGEKPGFYRCHASLCGYSIGKGSKLLKAYVKHCPECSCNNMGKLLTLLLSPLSHGLGTVYQERLRDGRSKSDYIRRYMSSIHSILKTTRSKCRHVGWFWIWISHFPLD